ncbi:MAG: hypothetical protein ABL982_24235 [Vicinamibacterales bacterium]
MTVTQRTELLARDVILGLLSDAENARVSSAEGMPHLAAGTEYLDLEHTHAGIQQFRGGAAPSMGTIIPRTAVTDATWNKIVAQVTAAKAG